MRILILGGTAEARGLAQRLASRSDIAVTLSLAGRTAAPAAQPVPVRIGGFGGADGLAEYLCTKRIDALVDATHPYAAIISANAARAAQAAGVPLDPSFAEQKEIMLRCRGIFYGCKEGAEARRLNRLLIDAGVIHGL